MKTDIENGSLDHGHPCQFRVCKLSDADKACPGSCKPRYLLVLKGYGYLGLGFEDRHREREPGPWTPMPDQSRQIVRIMLTKLARANVGPDICLYLRVMVTLSYS